MAKRPESSRHPAARATDREVGVVAAVLVAVIRIDGWLSVSAAKAVAQMHRVLAVIYVVPGIGWAVATLAVLLYHRERGELPMTPFGWRLLGGPYPEIGTDRLTPLGWALAWLLIAVSGVDVLIGGWLWQGRRRGAVLALVMAPVSFALGRLFVLPYLLVMAPICVLATIVAWRDLRR